MPTITSERPTVGGGDEWDDDANKSGIEEAQRYANNGSFVLRAVTPIGRREMITGASPYVFATPTRLAGHLALQSQMPEIHRSTN